MRDRLVQVRARHRTRWRDHQESDHPERSRGPVLAFDRRLRSGRVGQDCRSEYDHGYRYPGRALSLIQVQGPIPRILIATPVPLATEFLMIAKK